MSGARRYLHLLMIVVWGVATVALSGGCKSGVDRSDGRLPTLTARKVAKGAIVIDGRPDEAAWAGAGSTGPLVLPQSGKAARRSPVAASAQVAWDDERLYIAFTVQDAAPSSPFGVKDVDPHIWARASGIEVMLQPGDPGDNRHYYEVQVDVKGAVWDTRFDDYNRPITGRPGARRFGHQSWAARLERAVSVQREQGRYQLELALPFAALVSPWGAMPPKPGDRWRMNFYSFKDGQRHALAWSPLLGRGNFHRAERFGRVTFVE